MSRSAAILVALLPMSAFAADPASLAGTWNVTTKTTSWSTCPASPDSTPGKVDAYVWIVSAGPSGSVSVSVQGATGFPILYGNQTGTNVVLQGDGARSELALMAQKEAKLWFALDSSSGELVGVRRYLGIYSVPQAGGGTVSIPCFIDSEVRAKKA